MAIAVAATNGGSNTTAVNSHTVNLPTGIAFGNLLVVVITIPSVTITFTTPNGWTAMTGATGTLTGVYWFYRRATGDEPSSITIKSSGAATRSSYTSFRITGDAYGIAPEQGTWSGPQGSAPDPPALTPSWGNKAALWLIFCGMFNGEDSITSTSAGYSTVRADNVGGTANDMIMATQWKVATAASDNPGAWVTSFVGYAVNTIAIKELEAESPPTPIAEVSPPNIVGYLSSGLAGDVETPAGDPYVSNFFTNGHPQYLTHFIKSVIHVTGAADATLIWVDASQYTEIAAAKAAAGYKFLLCIGGGDADLEPVLANAGLRAQLVANLRVVYDAYSADGIDIDWEGAQDATHTSLMDTFIGDLYTEFHGDGALISFYTNGTPATFETWRDISLVTEAKVDFIFISGYCFDPAGATGLYARARQWAYAGFTRSKILLSVSEYGMDSDFSECAYWRDIVDAHNPTSDLNTLTINTIECYLGSAYTVTGGVLYFDGIDRIKTIIDYAALWGYGGIFIFDVGMDKFANAKEILKNIYDYLYPASPSSGGVVGKLMSAGLI